jgi:polysaccharide biosynthesis/export protein
MNRKLQGGIRPFGRCFSWFAVFFLFAVTSAYCQQTKGPVQAPAPAAVPAEAAAAETNNRIAQLAAATTAKQGDYIIGSGDMLGVEVFDVPELSRDVRVNESGYISLPLLPVKIRAAGLSTFQLQDKLAELLQTNGLVSTPQVTVNLKEQHSQPITVIGEVKSPMVIQAMTRTTLIQALSQAGGIGPGAGNTVIVTRPAPVVEDRGDNNAPEDANATHKTPADPQTFTVNLSDLLDSGDSRFNIPVLGGDVISVPHAGIIYVVGAVSHPGGFVIQNDNDRMTTLKILSLAGGTTNVAKSKQAVILRKNAATGQRDEIPVNLDKVMQMKSQDVTMESSDILFVPDSSGKRALHRAGDVALSLTTGVALISAGRI